LRTALRRATEHTIWVGSRAGRILHANPPRSQPDYAGPNAGIRGRSAGEAERLAGVLHFISPGEHHAEHQQHGYGAEIYQDLDDCQEISVEEFVKLLKN